MFYFRANDKGIFPVGSGLVDDNIDDAKPDTSCIAKNGSGLGCAAWVVYKGNMDYLKCPEKLSWNGKTSCR